jgi:hypothetical protein
MVNGARRKKKWWEKIDTPVLKKVPEGNLTSRVELTQAQEA